MTAKREDIGPRQVALEVVVDPERVERHLRSASRRIAREMKIPGFRPGKAPHEVVVRHVGEERVMQEALDELAPEIYQEAVQQEGLEPFDRGELRILSDDPLTVRMTVPLAPRVELPDYRAWKMDPPQPEVSEDDFRAALEEVREAFAEQAPVDRPARHEDLITLDVRATAEGEEILSLQQVNLILREGSDAVAPGFVEAVSGLSAGESRAFELTFPEDFEDEELRSRTARFEVQAHAVKERHLPELDEELARSAGVESVEELKERVRANLEARARLEAESDLAEDILERLVSEAEIEYPPIALEREINDLLVEQAILLRQQGFSLESYLEAAGLSEEEFRAQLAERARERLNRSLVLSRVVEQEEIRVEQDEVEREVSRMASRYPPEQQEEARHLFGSESSVRNIVARLYGQKALQKVVAAVTGREEELERERVRRQILLPHEEGQERRESGIVVPGRGGGDEPKGGLVRSD